jgi:manganese transport protein
MRLTADRALMGADANSRLTSALGWSVAAVITLLNVALIYLIVGR